MASVRHHLSLLPVLHVLLAECSVSRAAEKLNLTQSAVSQILSRARKLWGDDLLVRHGQRMLPTPLAVELATRIEIWMAETEALLRPPAGDPRHREATIVITANDYTEVVLLPPVLHKLSVQAPRVTVMLRSIEANPMDSQEFMAGHVHFALAGIPPPQGPFEARALFKEHFVLIARRGQPRVTPALSLEDYIGLQHVLVTPQGQGITGVMDTHLATLGVSRRIALSVTRFMSLPAILSVSDMVATVPSRFAALADVRRTCKAVPLPFPSRQFTMSLIWHRRHHNDPLHRWIREFIAQELSLAVEGEAGGRRSRNV